MLSMPHVLPPLIAGPLLRRATSDQLCLWAVLSQPMPIQLVIHDSEQTQLACQQITTEHYIRLGTNCHLLLIDCCVATPLPRDVELNYDLVTAGSAQSLLNDINALFYPNEHSLTFIIPSCARHIAHGSCRHPHAPCQDSLAVLDNKYALQPAHSRPNLLIMSGDQIYADDVCGPLLYAIRKAIDLLGLDDQPLPDNTLTHCSTLNEVPIYHRGLYLPKTEINHSWFKRLVGSKPDPIFSSNTLDNHLISFNEYVTMYLLVRSPALWSFISLPDTLPHFNQQQQQRWNSEKQQLAQFCHDIPQVRRLMAHIPTYMIFDDHDITDDFNLTLGWEQAVFNNPFAQSIITHGMLGYFLCQGFGNYPQAFNHEFLTIIKNFTATRTLEALDNVTTCFHHFENWHYKIPTEPNVVVIDTRTRRWRSETKYNKPSGLMDWESLMDFQQAVFNKQAVIVVSPAPMFGVKFIETLQRIATLLGKPLATDSENWMAHPGSAEALLNIFKHPKTPKNFVILSGDVHYSFAYDISIRFRKGSPKIWQITCSGFRNQFPEPFLTLFEWLDRKLFWPQSPLNIFTKRKRMRIERRLPNNGSKQFLVNQSAVGEVWLNEDGSPRDITILTGTGDQINFILATDE